MHDHEFYNGKCRRCGLTYWDWLHGVDAEQLDEEEGDGAADA